MIGGKRSLTISSLVKKDNSKKSIYLLLTSSFLELKEEAKKK